MNERQLQDFVRETALTGNWLYFHSADSRKQAGDKMVGDSESKGFPDTLMIHRHSAHMVIAECKVPPNKTTPEQDEWLEAFRRSGQEVYIWTPADQDAILERLLGDRVISS
jgi:hypothetical protein